VAVVAATGRGFCDRGDCASVCGGTGVSVGPAAAAAAALLAVLLLLAAAAAGPLGSDKRIFLAGGCKTAAAEAVGTALGFCCPTVADDDDARAAAVTASRCFVASAPATTTAAAFG
jgi:hypothetical protein